MKLRGMQILGRVLSRPRPTRGEAGFGTLLGDTIIYACFSNWQVSYSKTHWSVNLYLSCT